jgi:teichuronic acid biosynthesis glycosyltransferase TuaC
MNNLRILVVLSGNATGEIHHTFVFEQIDSIKSKYNIDYDTILIKGKGIFGYLKNLKHIKSKIKKYKPDLVHAHFGLSGLLSNLQRTVPVITTYHGSEIRTFAVNLLSSFCAILSGYNIYVAHHIRDKMYFKPQKNFSIIPCGIDLNEITEIEKSVSQSKMNLNKENINIVFSGAFDNPVKNYDLAKTAIGLIPEGAINLIELKGYKRSEVNYLLNACDLVLLTSMSEGSPQIIKEAMACNCPIVAADVGDIKEVISGIEGCYITSMDPGDVAGKIRSAIKFAGRTKGREKIMKFDNNLIAEKVHSIYKKLTDIA